MDDSKGLVAINKFIQLRKKFNLCEVNLTLFKLTDIQLHLFYGNYPMTFGFELKQNIHFIINSKSCKKLEFFRFTHRSLDVNRHEIESKTISCISFLAFFISHLEERMGNGIFKSYFIIKQARN